MSILGSNGKHATPGLPCIYQLVNGTIFYSDAVKEDADSFIFDGNKTVVISMTKGAKPGMVNLEMMKLMDWGYKALQTRVMKASVAMVQDTSEPSIIAKAKEALSGIVLPGAGSVN